METGFNPNLRVLALWGNNSSKGDSLDQRSLVGRGQGSVRADVLPWLQPRAGARALDATAASGARGPLTWLGASGGMGDGDLDWKASWEMNPESWEDTLDRRTGACWARLELR